MTPSPTGMEIGPPVSVTATPRLRPSVPDIATVRTQLSPRCCCTSSVSDTGCSCTVNSHVKRVVDRRQLVGKLDVHDRADDLNDFAFDSFDESHPPPWPLVISNSSLVMFAWRSLLYSSVRSLIRSARVVGRVLHRHHARALLAGLGLEQDLIQVEIQVAREQIAQHPFAARLEHRFGRVERLALDGDAGRSECLVISPTGRNSSVIGSCVRVLTKRVNTMPHFIDFALEKQVARESPRSPAPRRTSACPCR